MLTHSEPGVPPLESDAHTETLILETGSLLDRARWRERREAVARQVCRVELGGRAVGTGFLVAPDVVLTNHHVVHEVITGAVSPDFLVLRFDSPGVDTYRVARDWLLGCSPYSLADLMNPKPYEATREELDYALLRLEGQPGRSREWIAIPEDEYAFPPGSPILIVQHSQGERPRLTIETHGIIEVNGARTRVTYRTHTPGGSSGSPCFNQDWRLVALHHSGDPGVLAPYNEGIPISAIRAHLPEPLRGLLGWD